MELFDFVLKKSEKVLVPKVFRENFYQPTALHELFKR